MFTAYTVPGVLEIGRYPGIIGLQVAVQVDGGEAAPGIHRSRIIIVREGPQELQVGTARGLVELQGPVVGPGPGIGVKGGVRCPVAGRRTIIEAGYVAAGTPVKAGEAASQDRLPPRRNKDLVYGVVKTSLRIDGGIKIIGGIVQAGRLLLSWATRFMAMPKAFLKPPTMSMVRPN